MISKMARIVFLIIQIVLVVYYKNKSLDKDMETVRIFSSYKMLYNKLKQIKF